MYYSNDEMFLRNSVGTLDWNVQKKLVYKKETIYKDDTDARLIDVLGNLNKLQKAIQLADKVEGRTVGKNKIGELTDGMGKRFAVPVNGDEDNLAIFEIKYAKENGRTGFNGAVIKCVKGGGEYNGKTIAWADGSKGWGNLFKIQNPVAFGKTLRELWNDWFVNDFGQIARKNPFNQFNDLVAMIRAYNKKHEDNKEEQITYGVGASMQGIGMSLASYVKGFERIIFRVYSGCISKDMLDAIREKLSKMPKEELDWELNPSGNGNLEVHTNIAEPLTKIIKPIQENNNIYLMKNCSKKLWGGHGVPAYFASGNKPVEYMVSTHAKSSENAETPAVHKKSKGEPTGGAAPVKSEGSKKSSGRSESDEDGHWITKNGNHILIEDELPRFSPRQFIYDGLEIDETNSGSYWSRPIDYEKLASNAKKGSLMKEEDLNRYWTYEQNPISKVGVFSYYGSQISSDLIPNKLYRVYRPAEEIASPEALKSLRLLPIVDEHQMLGVGDGLQPAEEKGVHGVLGETAYLKDGYLCSDMRIFSEHLKEQINNGKKDLSLGYRCEYDFTPGFYNGEPYDIVQRKLRYNHLALVQEGRMGSDVCVMDSKISFDAKGYSEPLKPNNDWPVVYFGTVSPEVLAIRNDPEMRAYLGKK